MTLSPDRHSRFPRLELENRLATAEQQRALQDSTAKAQEEEWEERLSRVQQEEESTRRELQSLRSNTFIHIVCAEYVFLMH